MATTLPHTHKLLTTYLTPAECREKALLWMAKAMQARDRRSANKFKKIAKAWEELAEELSCDTPISRS